MAKPSDADLPADLRALSEPVAAALSLELLELEVRGHRGSRKVRVVVDVADLDADGVDIDDIATLSRDLEVVLDEHDPIAGGYTLEVTSPGADRPLTTARDFARNRGRRVRVELPAGEGADVVEGEVVEVSASIVTISTDDGTREVAPDDIVRAHVVLPW